jgi:hypothetical protein
MRSILIGISLFLSAIPAQAWNWEGHQVVALVGEAHLTPAATSEVQRLLFLEGKSSMSEVSSWADSIRILKVPRQPSHSVRIPLDFSTYDPKRDCSDGNCIIAAIEADIAILSEKSANDEVKLTALKYLIHFVGDIHQPLHANKDIGNRKVVFKGEEQTLHRIWDRQIIKSRRLEVPKLAAFIDQGYGDLEDLGGPVDWALESRDIARDDLYPSLTTPDATNVTQLPDDYADQNWPIVESRLELAGLRLAETLNAAFSRLAN